MRTQTMVQLTETLVGLLDERAAREGVSRSQVVRDAVEASLREDAEAAALRAVVEGYRRQPVTDEEPAAAAVNARAVVGEEPWQPTARSTGWRSRTPGADRAVLRAATGC